MKYCSTNQMQYMLIMFSALKKIHLESKGECDQCPLCKHASLKSSDGTEYHFDCIYKEAEKLAEELNDYIKDVRSRMATMLQVCKAVKSVFQKIGENK